MKIERMIEAAGRTHHGYLSDGSTINLRDCLQDSAPALVALVKAAYAMVEFNSFQDPEHHKKQALRQALSALPEEWK